MNSQVQVLIRWRADVERTPTHCSIIIGINLNFCLCRGVCVQSNIYVARVLHFSAFIIIIIIINMIVIIIFSVLKVVYFRQGHELYREEVRKEKPYQWKTQQMPWDKYNLRVGYGSGPGWVVGRAKKLIVRESIVQVCLLNNYIRVFTCIHTIVYMYVLHYFFFAIHVDL